jgi:hypothetical protein
MIMEKLQLADEWPEGFAAWGMRSSSVISGRYARSAAADLEIGPSILEEVRQLWKMLAEVRHLAALTSEQASGEVPEVFVLHPLSTRKVVVQVLRRGPARFQLALEPGETREEG